MNITFLTLFSAAFVFYAYLGYPALIWLVSRLKRSSAQPAQGDLPALTLLISAYNEEAIIEKKIQNSLSLAYPRELLEIIVVSDGSNDNTNEIVSRYEREGVKLAPFEGRIGKTACLNRVVPTCTGQVIVFSDANSLYPSDALAAMAERFSDPVVGFVTGYTRYADPGREDGPSSLGFYAALEKVTKSAESRIGSCVGADGAIFAIRRHLYKPLLATDINDFVIPLSIVRQGYRGVLEERAFCVEQSAGDSRGEFRRQVRITNRTLRALFNNFDLFNPAAHGLFAFELFSHKAAKFLAPFFLVLFCACGAFALARTGPAVFFLVTGVVVACAAMLAADHKRNSPLARLASLAALFLTTNAAVLAGWFSFLRGNTFTTWSPVKR